MVRGNCSLTTSFSLSPTTAIAGPLRISKGILRMPSMLLVDLATIFKVCFPSGIFVVSKTNLTGGANSAKGIGSSSKNTFMILLSSIADNFLFDDAVFDMVGSTFFWTYQIFETKKERQSNDNNCRPNNDIVNIPLWTCAVRNVSQHFRLIFLTHFTGVNHGRKP